MRQETVGKHVLHADSIYFVWRTKEFHIRLKMTGAKTTFTNGSDAGPLHHSAVTIKYDEQLGVDCLLVRDRLVIQAP